MSLERTCTDYYFVFLISLSKRSAGNNNLPQGKHRPTGFNPEWGNDFPFALYAEDASGAGGMFCSAVEAKLRGDIVQAFGAECTKMP